VTEDREALHRQAIIESHKMEFDIHKTQATLVTGSLVAVIALSAILVPNTPRFLWLLGTSCLLLLFSMGWALAAMMKLMTEVMVKLSPYNARSSEEEAAERRLLLIMRWVSMGSFPVGIGVFAGYVWLNALF
jgi:hypothetical protein